MLPKPGYSVKPQSYKGYSQSKNFGPAAIPGGFTPAFKPVFVTRASKGGDDKPIQMSADDAGSKTLDATKNASPLQDLMPESELEEMMEKVKADEAKSNVLEKIELDK